MAKHIPFPQGPKNKGDLRAQGRLDPRLVALVRFLARQAAERDYADMIAERDTDPDTTKH